MPLALASTLRGQQPLDTSWPAWAAALAASLLLDATAAPTRPKREGSCRIDRDDRKRPRDRFRRDQPQRQQQHQQHQQQHQQESSMPAAAASARPAQAQASPLLELPAGALALICSHLSTADRLALGRLVLGAPRRREAAGGAEGAAEAPAPPLQQLWGWAHQRLSGGDGDNGGGGCRRPPLAAAEAAAAKEASAAVVLDSVTSCSLLLPAAPTAAGSTALGLVAGLQQLRRLRLALPDAEPDGDGGEVGAGWPGDADGAAEALGRLQGLEHLVVCRASAALGNGSGSGGRRRGRGTPPPAICPPALPPALAAAVPRLQRLRRLELEGVAPPPKARGEWLGALSALSGLRALRLAAPRLHLTPGGAAALAAGLRELDDLQLEGHLTDAPGTVAALAPLLPQLTRLALRCHQGAGAACAAPLARVLCPGALRALDIGGTALMPALAPAIAGLTGLSELGLADTGVSPRELRQLAPALAGLTALDLSGNFLLRDEGLGELPRLAPRLRRLDVGRLFWATSAAPLGALTALTALQADDVGRLDGAEAAAQLAGLSRLERLSLGRVACTDPAALAALAGGLPQLRFLSVNGHRVVAARRAERAGEGGGCSDGRRCR